MRLFVKTSPQAELVGKHYNFFISTQLSYRLTIKEVTRYTTLVNIQQQIIPSAYGEILAPSMLVRLYHDARMAEVNACQHISYIKPRYDYPNKKMYHPDEKQQINQFLKEWLQLCLQQGQIKMPLFTCTKKANKGNDSNNE